MPGTGTKRPRDGNSPPKTRRSKQGSFWIPWEAVERLMGSGYSALDICTYLTIARYSDALGTSSTAGRKSIKKHNGIGDGLAEEALSHLTAQQGRPEEESGDWLLREAPNVRDRAQGPSTVRWHINSFGSEPRDGVWFSNELVDGRGRFLMPLKRLRRLGDESARILIYLHARNEMQRYGGVHPTVGLHEMYRVKALADMGRYTLWHASPTSMMASSKLCRVVCGCDNNKGDQEATLKAIFWPAFDKLIDKGFIYKAVTVFDREVSTPDTQYLYALRCRNSHGYAPKGEEGLEIETGELARSMGCTTACEHDQSDGAFAVVVPSRITSPGVAGIYRLKFRVTNPRNRGSVGVRQDMQERQAEARRWVQEARALYTLDATFRLARKEAGSTHSIDAAPERPDTAVAAQTGP